MKQKIFDIRFTRIGNIVDELCVNNASSAQINAVLVLAEPGDEVLIIAREIEFNPNH